MKTHIFLFVALLIVSSSMGQAPSDLRPSVDSPEVSKFQQFTNIPVSLSSGIPQISIPIYQIKYGDIEVPISLQYDASGLKVDDISSTVGLKWSVNTGGVVNRIIKGSPDEGNPSAYPSSQIDIDGYYQDFGLTKLQDELNKFEKNDQLDLNPSQRYTAFNLWLKDLAVGFKDSQPDLFSFSTPINNGKFVFNQNREVVFLEKNNALIKEHFSNNQFIGWNIYEPNGLIFSFGKNNTIEKSFSAQINEITNHYRVGAWFLTKIKSDKTNRIVTFDYLDHNYSHIYKNTLFEYTTPCNSNRIGNCNDESVIYDAFPSVPPSSSNILPRLRNSKYMENHLLSKLIKKIEAGDMTVEFYYSSREDLISYTGLAPKKLDSILVKYKDVCVRSFQFNYSYHTSVNDNSISLDQSTIDRMSKRLILDNFVEKDCSTSIEKKYTFIYETSPLPHILSFGQDKWGYYNGKDENQSLVGNYLNSRKRNPADKKVNHTASQAGILKEMIYPTGGRVKFEYEGHLLNEPFYYEKDESTKQALIHLQSLPSSANSYEFTFNPNKEYDLKIALFKHQNGFGGKALSIIENMTEEEVYSLDYSKLYQTECGQSSLSYCEEIFDKTLKTILKKGKTYTIKVFSNISTGYSNSILASTRATLYQSDLIPNYDVGGNRIKTITFYDSNGTTVNKKSYNYLEPKLIFNPKPVHSLKYNYRLSLQKLYGLVGIENINHFIQQSERNDQNAGIEYMSGYFYALSTGHDPFIILYRGPHISYGSVEEIQNGNTVKSTFGRYKTYFELKGFQTDTTYPANPVIQAPEAGKLLYKEQKSVLSERTENYSFELDNTSNANIPGISVADLEVVNLPSIYYLQPKKLILDNDLTKNKFSTGTITQSSTYEYGENHNFLIKKELNTSKGQSIITHTIYPQDLIDKGEDTDNMMVKLVEQHRIAEPVQTITYVKKPSLKTSKKLTTQKTLYKEENNLIVPAKIQTAKGDHPPEDRLIFDRYDRYGNVLESHIANDTAHTVTLWGYNGQYPIARIENATYNEVQTTLGLQAGQEPNENQLQALDALRASKTDWMITTYRHQPLVGVRQITPPNGTSTYYEYDEFNRLKEVKDKDQALLEAYQYHYANE